MTELSDMRKTWLESGADWELEKLITAGTRAIALSDSQLAINILRFATVEFESNTTVMYYLSLAYANSGSREEVYSHVEALLAKITGEDENYVESLCLMGRLEKDRYIRLKGTSAGEKALVSALEAYHLAFEFSRKSFPGINAATLFLLAGDAGTSRLIASDIIASNADDQDSLWQQASLGEANLLLENFKTAYSCYELVVALCGNDYGLLTSVKKHLPLIAEHIVVPERFAKLLAGPTVCVFSGHMFDEEGRASPRFPVEIEQQVAEGISELIDSENIKIGYCSAANGGDLLFAQEMINRDLEVNIVIPFDKEVFRRGSVKRLVDRSKEYWSVLDNASSVFIATEEADLGNPVLYAYAAELLEGYAKLRSTQFGSKVVMLAAIDRGKTGTVGGSSNLFERWRAAGMNVKVVDIAAIRGDEPEEVQSEPDSPQEARSLNREIKTVVEVIVQPGENLEQVSEELAARVPDQWQFMKGGGLNRAFATVLDAADYAYRLRAESKIINWQGHGLPEETTIQIALHTGPIFPSETNKKVEYFGSHVFHARDLAELTPAGCIYLTEQAAALLVTHGYESYLSDYLGTIEIKLKPRPVYRLHRA